MDTSDITPGLSPFQKRMQERTRSLQNSLVNETKVTYRLNPDGSLRPPSPVKKAEPAPPADPDKTQCYWSPLDGCFHPLSGMEKEVAKATGATLSKQVLHQESEEVRQLQRRVAELEFTATSAGITEEEVDMLRSRVHEAATRIDSAESTARDSQRRQQQLEAELQVARQGGGGGSSSSDGSQVALLRSQLQQAEMDLQAEREEKLKIAEQAATEKEMFIGIATGLENEVKETKQAMEQVLEEYPHLKQIVDQPQPAYAN